MVNKHTWERHSRPCLLCRAYFSQVPLCACMQTYWKPGSTLPSSSPSFYMILESRYFLLLNSHSIWHSPDIQDCLVDGSSFLNKIPISLGSGSCPILSYPQPPFIEHLLLSGPGLSALNTYDFNQTVALQVQCCNYHCFIEKGNWGLENWLPG